MDGEPQCEYQPAVIRSSAVKYSNPCPGTWQQGLARDLLSKQYRYLLSTPMSRFVFTAVSLLGILMGSTAFAATRDEQTAACKGDALHYCAAQIPNEQKITVCMKAHLQQLSPECKAMFKQPASSKHKKVLKPA
ncbi:hypothetical protein ACMX25_26180 [Caballeronia sp. 15715]|uniref:hypothetical protein n=1 Tax=Caballeronia sp. 15715 TaxID=3391030 RepID=UPI0039E65AA8